jgi:hypothetical protein
MTETPKTWQWLLACLSGIPSWMLILFVVGHKLAKVPWLALVEPFLALVSSHMAFGLTLYWLYSKVRASSRGKYLLFPIGLYFVLVAFIFFHYAGRFGVISASEARRVLLIFLLVLALCLWGANHTLKALRSSSQGDGHLSSRKD